MLMKVVNNRLTVRQTEDEVAKELGRPLPSEVAKQKAAARKRELSAIAPEAELAMTTPTPTPASQPKAKKGKKRRTKAKPAKQINDARLALNTIKKSIKLATDSGFTVTTTENDNDQVYQLVIEIPKKQ